MSQIIDKHSLADIPEIATQALLNCQETQNAIENAAKRRATESDNTLLIPDPSTDHRIHKSEQT